MSKDEFNLKVKMNVLVTKEDIDDIMACALEGGINYWCRRAEVVGKYLGEFASEQISRGGKLKLYDAEEDAVYELTREKFLKGLEKAIVENYYARYNWCNGHELDVCMIDAEVADAIVQLAIFDDVIYG